ncbi:unnamed protein product [Mytilus coruscus]|uniref:Uncharacterized protein n=1 Tax=Mytilus coruscus TaxID=42192 RepID=A0A6J8EB64_MYTCO|nr:unnamed protein product [Mytilus coruscus]
MVHVVKRLHGSLSNWFLQIDGNRANAVFLSVLRQSVPELKSILSYASVRRKDRMDFGCIIEICQQRVIDITRDQERVTVTLIPEKYQLWNSNQKGTIKQPVDVTVGLYGTILVLDYEDKLFQGRLHYPVDVSLVAEGFQTPTSLAFMNAFAFICESSVPCISYVDITGQLSLKIYALNKQELMQKCQELDLVDAEAEDSQFTKKKLQEMLKGWQKTLPKEDMHSKRRVLNVESLKIPTCVAAAKTENSERKDNTYKHRIGRIEHITLQHKDGDDELLSLHGIAFLNENTLLVSDRDLNKLFAVDLESKEVRHIGGNGEQKCSDGESMSASHGQPLGLCVEQNTIYVTEGASQAIRMVSNTIGLANVLERLKLSFETFSIHDRRKNDESRTHTLDEAIENLISVGHFFDDCIDFIRGTTNKPSLKPQGPEDSVAFKTVESVHMITNCLRSIEQNLRFKLQVSYGSHINLLSMLTLQVEHHFSNMRDRYPSPMVLQYGQQLLSTAKKTIKRRTNTGYHYYTHRSSFYPLPEQSPAFSLMEFPKKDRKQQSSLSADEKDDLMSFRKDYCQSVRQKTVRQQSTMYNAGTLPLNCYEEPEARSEQIEMWDLLFLRQKTRKWQCCMKRGILLLSIPDTLQVRVMQVS